MTIAAEIKPMIVPSALLASRVRVIGAGVCLLWSLCVQAVRADDWFWVNSKINGKPARLVLDTGCEPGLALFRHASERLKLKLQAGERRNADRIPYWFTEECTVKLPWSFWDRFCLASLSGSCIEMQALGWRPGLSQRSLRGPR